MLKNIVEAQKKLGTEKIEALNLKLKDLESKKANRNLNDNERLSLRFQIEFLKQDKEYWRGAKNTAELILNGILEEELEEANEFEEMAQMERDTIESLKCPF